MFKLSGYYSNRHIHKPHWRTSFLSNCISGQWYSNNFSVGFEYEFSIMVCQSTQRYVYVYLLFLHQPQLNIVSCLTGASLFLTVFDSVGNTGGFSPTIFSVICELHTPRFSCVYSHDLHLRRISYFPHSWNLIFMPSSSTFNKYHSRFKYYR